MWEGIQSLFKFFSQRMSILLKLCDIDLAAVAMVTDHANLITILYY